VACGAVGLRAASHGCSRKQPASKHSKQANVHVPPVRAYLMSPPSGGGSLHVIVASMLYCRSARCKHTSARQRRELDRYTVDNLTALQVRRSARAKCGC
jgi:hypothetical protein